MVLNVIAHEFPKDLGGGLISRPTHLKKFVVQDAPASDAEPRILHHASSVANELMRTNRFVQGTPSWSRLFKFAHLPVNAPAA
jgi:hypothetical protein